MFSQPPRLTGAARVHRRHVYASLRTQNLPHALAYRRSTTALAVRAFGPWAQLQARLPGTWQDASSCKRTPTGEHGLRVLTRALPAPACPSPGNAPPGPVVVPVSMMPEAARVRSVSFRARAPHSLRFREYPRPKASFTERDSFPVTEMGTGSQGKSPQLSWRHHMHPFLSLVDSIIDLHWT